VACRLNHKHSFYMLVFIALFAFSLNVKADPLQASTLDYPPYEYMENGQAKGIAVDIIKEAIKRSGDHSVEFSFYPWRRAVNSVEFGSSDILFNAGKNEARQVWGYYVESPLILQKYVLFKLKGDEVKVNANFDNVKSLAIAIRTGYLYGSGVFRKALDRGKFSYLVQSETTKQSIDLLLNKRVDMFVGDYLPVMHYIQKNGLDSEIDIVVEEQQYRPLIVLTWPTYILFSKKRTDISYVHKIDRILNEMKQDGTYDMFFHKYQNVHD